MKALGRFLVSSLIAFLILLALAPTVFSTHWGKALFLQMISKKLSGHLEVESLSLSWFGKQELEKVEFFDHARKVHFNCNKFETTSSLWNLLFRYDLGEMKISSPHLKLRADLTKATALQKGLKTNSKLSKKAGFVSSFTWNYAWKEQIPHFIGNISLENGDLEVLSPGLDPITFSRLSGVLKKNLSSASLNASGQTQQEKVQGQFEIHSTADQLQLSIPNLQIKAKIDQLPVRGIDQIASLFRPELNGLFLSAIGPSLNLDLSANIHESVDVSFNLSSDYLKAQLETKTSDGIVSLTSPANISFALTPIFFQKIFHFFPQLREIKLINPVQAKMQVRQISLPVTAEVAKLAFDSVLSISSADFSSTKTQDQWALGNIRATLATPKLEDFLSIQMSGLAKINQSSSQFTLDGNWQSPFQEHINGTLNLQAEQIPMGLIDQILGQKALMTLLFGPTLDATAKARIQNSQGDLVLKAQSTQFSLPETHFKVDHSLSLAGPTTLQFSCSPLLLRALTGNTLQLAEAKALTCTIDSLEIPFSSSSGIQKLGATLQIPNLNFNQFFSWEKVAFDPITCRLNLNTLNQILLNVQGNSFRADLEAAYKPEEQLITIKKPVQVDLTLTDALVQTLWSNPSSRPYLVNPAILHLHFDPMTILLSSELLNTFKMTGNASIDQLLVSSQNQSLKADLRNLLAHFQFDGKKGTAALDFSAEADSESTLEAHLVLEKLSLQNSLDLSQSTLRFATSMQNLSSSSLEALTGKNFHLKGLIGPTINLDLKTTSTPDSQQFEVKATSSLLNINAGFVLKENQIQLLDAKQPAELYYTINQDNYTVLDQLLTGQTEQQRPFQLKAPSILGITLEQFICPFAPRQPIKTLADRFQAFTPVLTNLQFKGSLQSDQFSFLEKKSNQSINLTDLALHFDKPETQGPIHFSVNSSLVSKANNTSKEGKVAIVGKMDHLYSSQGSLDLTDASVQINANIQQLPVIVFDIIFRAMGKTNCPFSPLCGDTLNATMSTQIQNASGPFKLNINSPNTRASVIGQVNQGKLNLSEPIYAQISLTPEISALILTEINPLSISSIYSSNPLTLEIPAEGFSFPLFSYDPTQIFIPKARIELGKITCENEGNLNITLGLLKSRQLSKEKQLKLWFAPIDVRVEKGILDWERTEILVANTFEIALWGKLDFVSDYVDMILGLTPQCLDKAFGIKNLPRDYILQIPMKGPSDKVQINTGKATAKVAALLLWQQQVLAGTLKGSPGGALLGGLLNKLATLPDKDASTPPAKRPFPWDSGKESSLTQEPKTTPQVPQKKKTKIKKSDKPLKQLLKVLK